MVSVLGHLNPAAAHVTLSPSHSRTTPRVRWLWLLVMVFVVLPSAGGGSAAVSSSVVLNENLYFEDPTSLEPVRDHEWVELHNKGLNTVDLNGWVISDRDGRAGGSARALPAVLFPPGAYLVVHFATGVNDFDFSDGCGAFFTGDSPAADLLDNEMDEVGLYSPTAIVDFIAWHRGATGYVPGTAHDNAVGAAEWIADSFLDTSHIALNNGDKFRVVKPGTSIGRDKDSTDLDRPQDFDAHGGRDAGDITFCRRNLDLLALILPPPPPPVGPKAWTVMIYLDGDNDLESSAYQDLKEIERAGGSDDNINVVVMVDGLSMLTQGFIDGNNQLIFDPATTGKTWRFQVGPELDPRAVAMLSLPGEAPLLGERDMGDPAELGGFIGWAKANYPAQNFALIVWDHGSGWKGIARDDSSLGALGDNDRLYMGEIASVLAGHLFELIGFDACLMAMIEVAYQVEPFSNYMVASEETVAADGWPYDRWLPRLKANPAWNGAQLGSQIVDDFHAFYSEAGGNQDDDHTVSVIDQSQIPNLVAVVSAFGDDLRRGADDFNSHDTPEDNVEHRIALDADRPPTERFGDWNFMDLHDFASNIDADGVIPQCYKSQLAALLPLSARLGPVVIAEQHGPNHPDANGLSIYMPLMRARETPDPSDDEAVISPYDSPFPSRVTDGDTAMAVYAFNKDALPFQAEDPDTGAALAAPPVSPREVTPAFRFPADTLWDEFLMRFYHPVADNRILFALGPNGEKKGPKSVIPACGNPIDEITILPGWTVFFSGVGSSDADTIDRLPTHWMWDFDAAVKECGPCKAPYELDPGVDAAAADDDMNADHDANKVPLNDEKAADAQTPNRTYVGVRDYIVTLHAWDDNHEFDFHDTLPTARYVHPQTDDHISIVHVVPPKPDQLHLIGPIPNQIDVGKTGTITATVQASFIGLFGKQVAFSKVSGNFHFTTGQISTNGKTSKVTTDADGKANVTVMLDGPGPAVLRATVAGTSLVAYSFFSGK